MISYEDLEKYCKGKHFKLSDQAPKIYKAIKRRNGNCPCRVEEEMCPCPNHLEEIESEGKCKCNLFVERWNNPEPRFRKKYPELFSDYFISFGFGKGWEPIVTRLMDAVREENKKDGVYPIHVVQVKEKFGGLRFYTDTVTEDLQKIIREGESEASQVCEQCGSTHNVSAKGSWIKTYCEECHLRSEIEKMKSGHEYNEGVIEDLNSFICDLRVEVNCQRDFGECDCIYCQVKDKTLP